MIVSGGTSREAISAKKNDPPHTVARARSNRPEVRFIVGALFVITPRLWRDLSYVSNLFFGRRPLAGKIEGGGGVGKEARLENAGRGASMIENYEIEYLAEGVTRIQEKFIAPMDMSLLLQAPLFF